MADYFPNALAEQLLGEWLLTTSKSLLARHIKLKEAGKKEEADEALVRWAKSGDLSKRDAFMVHTQELTRCVLFKMGVMGSSKRSMAEDLSANCYIHVMKHVWRFEMKSKCPVCEKEYQPLRARCTCGAECRHKSAKPTRLFCFLTSMVQLLILQLLKHEKHFDHHSGEENCHVRFRESISESHIDELDREQTVQEKFDHIRNVYGHHPRAKLVIRAIDQMISSGRSPHLNGRFKKHLSDLSGLGLNEVTHWLWTFKLRSAI